MLFSVIFTVKEATRCYRGGKKYLTNPINSIPVFLIISFGIISFHDNPFNGEITLMRYQYHVACFGVFFTWLYQTILMQKTPKFGLYIEMLFKVSQTFLNFVMAYSFLFSAFAISFYILFPGAPSFDNNIFSAFIKVSFLEYFAYCTW